MSVSLSFPTELHSQLLSHLRETQVEQVAFLFTTMPIPNKPLRVAELFRVPPKSFDVQSGYHVALADEVRGHVIGRAWQLGGCLIEAHSHGGGHPASFSSTDIFGLVEWVPHVRWRLRGRTYVALVFGDDSFDGLVWSEAREGPGPLAGVEVDGGGILRPTGITYSRLSEAHRDS